MGNQRGRRNPQEGERKSKKLAAGDIPESPKGKLRSIVLAVKMRNVLGLKVANGRRKDRNAGLHNSLLSE